MHIAPPPRQRCDCLQGSEPTLPHNLTCAFTTRLVELSSGIFILFQLLQVRRSVCVAGPDWTSLQVVKRTLADLVNATIPLESFQVRVSSILPFKAKKVVNAYLPFAFAK